jgi:hypothetical protein
MCGLGINKFLIEVVVNSLELFVPLPQSEFRFMPPHRVLHRITITAITQMPQNIPIKKPTRIRSIFRCHSFPSLATHIFSVPPPAGCTRAQLSSINMLLSSSTVTRASSFLRLGRPKASVVGPVISGFSMAAPPPHHCQPQRQQMRFRSAANSDAPANSNDQHDLALPEPCSKTSHSSPISSSAGAGGACPSIRFRPVYVHHVSRVALQHLQDRQHEWLTGRGLDRGLVVRPDGTFLMNYPTTPTPGGRGHGNQPVTHPPPPGRIWTSYDARGGEHWLNVCRGSVAVRFLLLGGDGRHDRLRGSRGQELQQRGVVAKATTTSGGGTYPTSTVSTPSSRDFYYTSVHSIEAAVDEMIRTIDGMDEQQQIVKRTQIGTESP